MSWKNVFLISIFPYFLISLIFSATISSQRIGCVDIYRIIEEYPEAKKIKEEFSAKLELRKEYIKDFRSQIEATENDIKNMEEQLEKYKEQKKEYEEQKKKYEEQKKEDAVTALAQVDIISSTNTVVSSTDTVTTSADPTPPPVRISSPTFTSDDIKIKKDAFKKHKEDLEKYIKTTKNEEKRIGRKIRKNIYGKIYDVVREIADEEGLTVIVGSDSLIYGEGALDITEKVLKKLK